MAALADAPGPRAVLLLHGQPGGAGDWDRVTAELDPALRVLAPDRPGYGANPEAACGFFANASQMVSLLDEVGVGRALVAGHSWGGGIALAMAERHPERVAGLVLVASVGARASVGKLDEWLSMPGLAHVAALTGIAAGNWVLPALQRILPRLPGRVARELADSIGTDPIAWRAPGPLARTIGSFATEQRALVEEIDALAAELGAIETPVQVLAGTRDPMVSFRASEALARAIPGAELTPLPGRRHLLPMIAPEAVAEAIGRVWARAAGPAVRGAPRATGVPRPRGSPAA